MGSNFNVENDPTCSLALLTLKNDPRCSFARCVVIKYKLYWDKPVSFFFRSKLTLHVGWLHV